MRFRTLVIIPSRRKLNVGSRLRLTRSWPRLWRRETEHGVGDGQAEQDLIGRRGHTVLGLKLDRLSDSVTGQTTIDPKGYLTDLGSQRSRVRRTLRILKYVDCCSRRHHHFNPKHGPGWIKAARLEELAGKLQQARASQRCDVSQKRGCLDRGGAIEHAGERHSPRLHSPRVRSKFGCKRRS